MPAQQNLRIAVVGAGVFGRNHLRVYRELEQHGHTVTLAAVVDSDLAIALKLGEEWHIPAYSSVSELLKGKYEGKHEIDAVSVCVPTSAHFAAGSELLANGIDVLIEKPIASSLTEADGLMAAARDSGRVLQVGHLERFNPAVTAIGPYLNGPMFFEAHRLSVFTPRALDVDVVLDLMIHDLDIVLHFAQSPVREVRAVGLPVLSPKVDIANVRIEFDSGCVANFTASRVSTERVRKLRFFQPHQYVSIDYARKDLLVVDVGGNAERAAMNVVAGQSKSPGMSFTKPEVVAGEPLRLEIESFLNSVRTRSTPRVTGEEGRAALALALEINAAIARHSARAGLNRFAPRGF